MTLLCVCDSHVAPRTTDTIGAIGRGGNQREVATTTGPLALFVKTIKEARTHLTAAGVARSISIFAMYPIDTIKTRVQMEQPNAMRIEGLYKGVAGSLFGQVPYG